MKKFNLLSIIVPAYKQEKTIIQDIEKIAQVMSQLRYDYEIIVVIDGFIDDTFKNAKKIKSLDKVTEIYKIIDDKRVAFNLNTKQDFELLGVTS